MVPLEKYEILISPHENVIFTLFLSFKVEKADPCTRSGVILFWFM